MTKFLSSLLLACLCTVAFAAGERGWFGFASSIDTSGMIWNPTLVSITIQDVTPGSPAALAHVAKGDQVVEVDGKAIAGAKGTEIKSILDGKAPGDSMVVRLKHPNGEFVTTTLVAQRRPDR